MALDLNPILSELDGLSPQAKGALVQAHQNITGAAPAIAPVAQAPAPSVRPMPVPGAAGVPSIGMSAPAPSPSPMASAHTAELGRLTTGDTGKSGIAQIKSPWARIPLQIADAIGGGLFPGIEQRLPGTEGHHQVLVREAQGNVAGDEAAAAGEAKNSELAAQTANLNSMPELHQAQVEAAAAKNRLASEKSDEDKRHHQATEANSLREHGFKLDEQGNVVPLPYGEMSQEQQSVHDLKASQQELQEATAAYRKAQKENIPAAMQMAQQRIATANNNAAIAARRLGLSEAQYNMRAFGTDAQGNALPGTILTDNDQPVGSSFQQNVRPTGQERNKGDLASSAHDQLDTIKDIVSKRKDIFGPVSGRKTDFSVWVGSQDPDAQRFRAARTIAGDHLAGVFGGRSEAALEALDHAIGQFKDNPQAVLAGIDQLDRANNRFIEKGTPRTTGSDAAKNSPHAGESKTSGMIKVQIPGHPPGEIEASQKAAFLKKFPNAKVLQ